MHTVPIFNIYKYTLYIQNSWGISCLIQESVNMDSESGVFFELELQLTQLLYFC